MAGNKASPRDALKSTRLIPPQGGVVVRAYRQGLGDCFLLAFSTADAGRTRYLLIDCGVHMRQDAGTKRLAEVMEDLVAATGGKIDVVVATHEHADHLSGFVQKGSPFLDGSLDVDEFWVAWTEKVGDPQADVLRRRRGAARAAIEKAIEKLGKSPRLGLDQRLRGLMDFETMPAGAIGKIDTKDAGEKANPSSNELALGFLKKHAAKIRYCEPGQVVALPGVTQVRAYVLGPPREQALLYRDLPTGGPGDSPGKETYLAGRALQRAFVLAPGLEAPEGTLPASSQIPEDFQHPFESNLRRDFLSPGLGQAAGHQPHHPLLPETDAFFRNHYFSSDADWRRIDMDWLAAAEEMALNLDSDTNNTSLVLAIECGNAGEGDVLLFVGDAQVGNWLSWRRQSYRTGSVCVSADDLLQRTILYKVGHHGSHNATVRLDPSQTSAASPLGVPFGLELMPSHMIALIPIDRSAAEKPMPIPWHMPYPPLYRHLLDKASGRVLRADGLPPEPAVGEVVSHAPAGPEWTSAPGMPKAKWREAEKMFQNGRRCPLYYDIAFEP